MQTDAECRHRRRMQTRPPDAGTCADTKDKQGLLAQRAAPRRPVISYRNAAPTPAIFASTGATAKHRLPANVTLTLTNSNIDQQSANRLLGSAGGESIALAGEAPITGGCAPGSLRRCGSRLLLPPCIGSGTALEGGFHGRPDRGSEFLQCMVLFNRRPRVASHLLSALRVVPK
jgi:hypothetical protein